jgi:hypothetical protein
MSNGPHEAAVYPPDVERCPHYHKQAENKPTTKNWNPNCPGRCIFYAGHPHPHGGHKDPASYQAVAEYKDNCCLCDTCHLWVRDWIQIG